MSLFPAVSRLIGKDPGFPDSVIAIVVGMPVDPEGRLVFSDQTLKVRHKRSPQKRPVKYGMTLGRRSPPVSG